MSSIEMGLSGSHAEGWRWRLLVDGTDLAHTLPLATEDLIEGLYSIQRDPSRRTPDFDKISDRDLGLLLGRFFAGDLYHILRDLAEAQVWAKNLVSPSLPYEFPGPLLFLMEEPDTGTDRLLAVDGVTVHGYRLPRGRFDALLREVRDRLDAALEAHNR